MTLELHRDASEVRGALARKGPLGYAIACPPAAAILRGALTTVETALEIGLPQGFAGDVVGCATATVFEGRYNNQQRLRAGAVSGDIRIGVFRVERTAEGFKGEISRWDPYAQLIGRDFTWRGAR